MTTPNGEVPEGAYVGEHLEGLNEWSEENAMAAMRTPVEGSFERHRDSVWGMAPDGGPGLLQMLASAFFGPLGEGETPALQRIRDGQLDLNSRLDLMDDVSGYAVAYIPVNFYRNANSWFVVPFRDRVGPQKNATVNGDGTITLAQGTWRVFAQMTSDQHADLDSMMRIEVLRPNGSIYSYKEFRKNVDPHKWNTYQGYHPVVIPGPGYQVRVRFRYNRGPGLNLYFRGGTHMSHLAVDRMDLSAENAVVDEDVPNE